ncbi:hypothetical protein M422DRAFT_208887 [Sphaerobolus stellatus SS14]|uniref:AB hydrolase-1 domain-containing protein n=1 Tax=Sphaerobolus stellatus (strain SS14) TaxID=990650 RepID=A0A0C9V623_SPHS4|nr:hypothetical protein M422DRAFT_214941 [Sphaerobolus stellatus SS14]KIJ42384.1 hypothetical protein M422DRAFT_208887 [Sphaerobolus stellatus SS14]
MPLLRLDGLEVEFYYQDSGVPILDDKPYTTLVILHGYSFNSHMFHRLMPIAKASHIRLILVNRRGYPGSTPFKPEETAGFDAPLNKDENSAQSPPSSLVRIQHYTSFLQQRGVEMARFLVKFIDIEKIPVKAEGRAIGGISLMGWSLGNVISLSMLAYANTYDPVLIKKLEPYLKKIIIYDPPHHALGFPTPAGAYTPMFDEAIPRDQRQRKFSEWVSAYYLHPESIQDPKIPFNNIINILEQKTPIPSKPTPLMSLSPADRAKGVTKVTPETADPFLVLDQARSVHKEMRIRALFGNYNEGNAPLILPNVGISYVWCTESIWSAVYAMKGVQEETVNPPEYHYLARTVKFFPIEGGNHWPHWDNPLRVMGVFAQSLE